MPVYAIADLRVHDPELFARYLARIAGIVGKHHGRYLSRGGRVTGIFGDWRPEQIVLIEFPTRGDLVRCFSSDEYREILPFREGSSTGSLIMVEQEIRTGASPGPG